MKEITFNEKKYSVPENWDEVTLRMVIRTSELDSLLEDAPIVSIIAGYCNIPATELKSTKMTEVKEILEILDFIYTPYVPVPSNGFTFQGVRYSANPDLTEQEFGDWVAIQTIMYNNRDNAVMGLAPMLAVYCKKDGEKLDDINIDERTEFFMDVPITLAKNVEGFFLHFQRALNSVILISSTEKEREELVLARFNELNSIMNKHKQGLGIFSPTRFVIGIYQWYLMYLKRQLEKSFNSKLTELSKRNWIATVKESHTKMLEKIRSKK